MPIIAAILVNIGLYFAERRHRPATAHWALVATSLIVISLLVFFTWVFPANQATNNWTVQPDNWELLRRDWKYGHAANAVLIGLALIALVLASISRRRK